MSIYITFIDTRHINHDILINVMIHRVRYITVLSSIQNTSVTIHCIRVIHLKLGESKRFCNSFECQEILKIS